MDEMARRYKDPRQKRRVFVSENVICASVFAFFTAVFGMTLCPAVFWWDSGELIANVAVLGIPHRPGFPIYVLVARLFSFLPFWSFAFKVNFLSCLFASFSMVIFYKTFRHSISVFFPQVDTESRSVLVSGLSFLLVFGFTYSFWIQAVRSEVYSLNGLFFSLLLFLAVRYLKQTELKYIYLFFFLLGLGLGNHHLSLLSTVPAFVFLLLVFDPRSLFNIKRISCCILFSLLGASVYLYLPIRSLSDPPLAWGVTESLSSSARSILGWDVIRKLNASFLSGVAGKISQIFSLLSDQLTLIVFLVSLVGLFLISRHNRKIMVFLLLLIAGNCAVVIFMTSEFIPTNPDLHGYLIFSIFALAFSFGLGILLVGDYVGRSSSLMRGGWLTLALAIALLPLSKHLPEADLSKNTIAHDYGLSVLSHLDSNSVLFADNVNLNFILRELQHGEGMRKDAVIIDRGLLGFDWYAEQQRGQNKLLFSGISAKLKGEPLFGALLKRCQDSKVPTYVEFTERDLDLAIYLVPKGYVFKVSEDPVVLLPGKDLVSQSEWDSEGPFDIQSEIFQRDLDAQRVFALCLYRLALYYESRGMISSALDRFTQLKMIDPDNEALILRMKQLATLQGLRRDSDPDSAFLR